MESKLRILAVNWQDPKNPFAGGAEVHLWENLKRFAADGHKVTQYVANSMVHPNKTLMTVSE